LALFEGFEPGVGAETLVPEGGEGAWEHGCGGGVVETVRVDVVSLGMTIGIGDGDGGLMTSIEVGSVLAGLEMGNAIEYQHR
jgi:hypothetical protein